MTNGEAFGNRANTPASAVPPAHPLDEKYYVRGETEAYGPYDGRTVKDMVEQGRLLPTTGIARVGATEWTEIKDHPYFGTLRRGGSFPAVGAEPVRLPGAPGAYQPSGSVAYQPGGPGAYQPGAPGAYQLGGPGAYQDPSMQSVRYAGFWIRLGAYIIDAIIVTIGTSIIGAIVGAGVGAGSSDPTTAAAYAGGVSGLLSLVIVILYQVLFLRSGWQATPGKRLLGLCVVTETGQRLSGLRALGRFGGYIISGLTLYIGFMMIGWNKEKKGLHDMICGTRVIYGRP